MATLAVVLIAIAACSGGDEPAATDLGEDAAGTCLDVPDDVGAEISDLPEVGCDVEHTHEIYAVVDSEADAYPGLEALEDEAEVACLAAFEPYVGISPFDSNLFYSWLVPTLASWEDTDIAGGGDREIVCVVGSGDGSPLTQSVRDSRR